jgi:hypothetical protein
VLNIENKDDEVPNKRLCTRYSISEKLNALVEKPGEYDNNSLFMVIPKATFHAQNKINKIIDDNHFPKHLQQDYESFINEQEANIDQQEN